MGSNLREALLKAGVAAASQVEEQNDAQLFRDHVNQIPSEPIRPERESRRKRRFMRGFRQVYRSLLSNPGVSGSMPSEARLRDAAGSDEGKKYRMSGLATPIGMRTSKLNPRDPQELTPSKACPCGMPDLPSCSRHKP